MRSTTRRLVLVSVATVVGSLVGFLLALVQQWPSQFILGSAPDTTVTVGDLVTGTATSIPLVPLLLLGVATALAANPKRWGTVGVTVLWVLGLVIAGGGVGEVLSSPTAHVARGVLLGAGVAAGSLGLAITLFASLDLADRARRRRATSQTTLAAATVPTSTSGTS